MRGNIIQLIILVILTSIVCMGCQKESISDIKKTHYTQENVQQKTDGQIISMKKVDYKGLDSSTEIYQMMYWSDGIKNEAFIKAPKGPGTYSLMVLCHGGWTEPKDASHFKKLGEVTYDASLVADVYNNFIAVAPTYRGYGNSDGKIKGVYENTIDTENAIKAVVNYFEKKGGDRHIQDIVYLDGWSMGGAVALKIAAERDDIKSVVATSPWVGWNIFDTWVQGNKVDDKWSIKFSDGEEAYGTFDPEYDIYIKQSVQYEKIKAPVLLIQGTDDESIPWQTVQILYDKMKANKQDVTLKLFDGGNHGLTNKADMYKKTTDEWYFKH